MIFDNEKFSNNQKGYPTVIILLWKMVRRIKSSWCDTRVEDPDQIKNDLYKIGFNNFEHWIRPPGPGDNHPNWIFFTAVK